MVDNGHKLLRAMLRASVAVAAAFITGVAIDGWYWGFALVIPSVCAVRLFKRKAPPCRERYPEAGGKKAVISLYFTAASADDVAKIESAALYAKSTNPQDNVKVAVMIDLDDQPVEKIREDEDVLACAENVALRLNERGRDFAVIVRLRQESKPQLEYIGKGRKTGALFDLADIIVGQEAKAVRIFGDRAILENAEYVAVVDDSGALTMDCVKRLMEYANGESGITYPQSDEYFCGRGIISVSALISCRDKIPCDKTLFCDRLLAGAVGERKAPVAFKSVRSTRLLDRAVKKAEFSRQTAQGLWYVFSEKLQAYQKIEVLSDLAYCLTPIIAAAIMLLSFAVYPPAAGRAALTAVITYMAGAFSRGERDLLGELLLLPSYALISAFGFIREACRAVFLRNTLSVTPIRPTGAVISALTLSICAFRSPSAAVRLLGLITAFLPLKLSAELMPPKQASALGYKRKKALVEQMGKMWRFFEEYVTDAENHLPPDSVQFSPDGILHHASPSGIGTYLVCCLAACDKKFIDVRTMAIRIQNTLQTVEKLQTKRGNLFERYDTKTLSALSQNTDDGETGLFLACLICLKEGLREYHDTYKPLDDICRQLDGIISKSDLSEVSNGFFFSSGRLASFLAVASRQLDKSHWQELARPVRVHGFKEGIASRYGGIDEFFISELFIKSPEGSATDQSLDYCLYCHKRVAKEKGLPYGRSFSGYASQDENMCYLSKQHGEEALACEEATGEYVVSPYSSYISALKDPTAAFEDLAMMENLKMQGPYGLYEAYDFDRRQVIMSYRSTHLGLSMIALSNLTDDGIMQKRTMLDPAVRGAYELLSEEMPKRDHDSGKPTVSQKRRSEEFSDISLFEPRVRFCRSGDYLLVMTDTGNCFGIYKNSFVYRFSSALYEQESGLKISLDGADVPVQTCRFTGNEANYYRNLGELSWEVKAFLHAKLPCEIRNICVENDSDGEIETAVEISFSSDGLNGVSMRSDHIVMRSGKTYIQSGFLQNTGAKILPERRGFHVRIPLTVPAKSKKQISMYLLCADSLEKLKHLAKQLFSEPIKQAEEPDESAQVRMAQTVLRSLLFGEEYGEKRVRAVFACPPVSRIRLGFERKLPLVTVCLNDKNDGQKLSLYLGAFKVLADMGIEINLAFIYRDGSDRTHYNELIAAIRAACLEGYVYSQIMPIDLTQADGGACEFLLSHAGHISDDKLSGRSSKTARKPLTLDTSLKRGGQKRWENQIFGTIVSDGISAVSYIGDTSNGIISDNERIAVIGDGRLICLPEGISRFDGTCAKVSISVAKTAMCKKISVTVDRDCELIYYCEPRLCLDKRYKKTFRPRVSDGTLIFDCPENTGFLGVYTCGSAAFISSKADLYSQEHGKEALPCFEPCAAVRINVKKGQQTDVYVSYAANERSLKMMPKLFDSASSAKAPDKSKIKILKMCASQFIEGDLAAESYTFLSGETQATRTVASSGATRLLSETAAFLSSGGNADILDVKVRYSRGLRLDGTRVEACGRVYCSSDRESVYQHLERAANACGDVGKALLAEIDGHRRKKT